MSKENYAFLKDANEDKLYNLTLCIEDYYCKKMYEPFGIASRKLVECIVKKIADKLEIKKEFLKDKKTGFVTLDSTIKAIFSSHLTTDDFKYFKDLLFVIKGFGNKCSHEINEDFDIEKESIDILQGVYRISCYYYKFFINENMDWYKPYQIPEQFDDKEIEALLKENEDLKGIKSDLENILLNKDEELANEKQKNDKFYEAVDKLSSSFEDVKKELNEYKNQTSIEFKRLQLEKNNSDIQDLANVINPKDFKDYETFIKDLNAYKISKEYDISVNDALEMLEENSFQEVREALDEASKKINAPKEECPPEDYYKQGFANFISKDYENALHYFNLCIENGINKANAYYYIGCIFQSQEKNENAIESLSEAIKLSPDEPLYYNMRANAYYMLNKYENALRDFNKTLNLDKDYSINCFRYGYTQDELELYEEAIESYSLHIKQVSDEEYTKFASYYNRGLIYKKQEEYEKAIDDFSNAIELDENDADTYYKRGECYYWLDKYRSALNDFSKTLELDNDYSINYFKYAYTLGALGFSEEAIESYSIYIGQVTDNDEFKPYAYNNRGNCYKKLEEYERAVEDYTKAIELDDKYGNAYKNRAEVYYELKEYSLALDDYNKALELSDDKTKDPKMLLCEIEQVMPREEFKKFMDEN